MVPHESPDEQQLVLPILPAAERPKPGSFAGIDQAANATDPRWRASVDRAIAILAARGVEFDVEAVRAEGVGDPEHPSAWGPPFAQAHRDGLIRCVGASPSPRPSRHRSLTRRWIGTDLARGAA